MAYQIAVSVLLVALIANALITHVRVTKSRRLIQRGAAINETAYNSISRTLDRMLKRRKEQDNDFDS